MLVAFGRPGSGCSSFSKVIPGETHGDFEAENSSINYQGIPKEPMHKDFQGELIYEAGIIGHCIIAG
jgi:ATP-binding cassette subfamily G (WHITE) protein 2 (PDR)